MTHFNGETLHIDPTEPFTLTVTIDNEDREEWPANPFTLNVMLGGDTEGLYIRGESCIIEGDVPTQLRALADAIESGEVHA